MFLFAWVPMPSDFHWRHPSLSWRALVQSQFDFGGCFAKLRACFDMPSRNTPWASEQAVASFNPGIQQMLQIGPGTPSLAALPHSHPASGHLISIVPHRVGQLKRKPAGQGSRVNLLREGDPGLPCQGLSLTLHSHSVQKCKPWGCPRNQSCWDLVQMAARVAATQNSVPRVWNFQNEIYSPGPPPFGRKHLLHQLWERASYYQLLCRDQIFAAN